ncbi:MAG: alkaline phosphatase family protein [Thermoanaerobaculum sp.]
MKKLFFPLFFVLVVAVIALFQPLGPGSALWDSNSGTLHVCSKWTLVPRWGKAVVLPRVATTGTLTTPEGATVTARVQLELAPGAQVLLAAAPTPEQGLAVKTAQLAPPAKLACLAQSTCRQTLQEELEASLHRMVSGSGKASVVLEPDPTALFAFRRQELRQKLGTPRRRVLVVGWDGADWELLSELVSRGLMPNLKRLMAAGTHGELTSITPLLSPLIWTTMATGERPEVHGVLDFLEVEPATGARVPVTSRKRNVPALWNMVSAAGLTVGVSGWWASWPAEAVNGVLVSDRLFFLLSDAPGDAPPGTVVFPPELEGSFRELAERAKVETDVHAIQAFLPLDLSRIQQALAQSRGMADPVDGFRRILVGTRVYMGAALKIAESKPHLLMAYGIGTDEVGHLLAPYLPPALPGTDAALVQAARLAVDRYFAAVDRWLGRLLEQCPLSECAVLVVSDHGFKWGSDRPREFSGVAAATAALWHRPKGIFVLAGNGVTAKGRTGEPASVYDVAPTVAVLLGLPLGVSWPGKPLPGVTATVGERVAWAELVPPESYRPRVQEVKPSAEYVAQLKALGYLEGGETQGGSGSNTEGELNNLGLVQLEAGRLAEAEEAFKKAIAANPAYASPHYNLRRLYFQSGRYEEADHELLEALRLGLRDGRGALHRALADYERLGLRERAATLANSAITLFPRDAMLRAAELRYLLELNRCAKAVERAREAVSAFPQDAAVLAFAGLSAACAGDTESAKTWMKRSLALNPNQPELKQALALLE